MPLQIGPCSWMVNNLLVGAAGSGRLFSAGGQLFFTDAITPVVSLNALTGGVVGSDDLQDSYDNVGAGGPPGAGRFILANSGAVQITKSSVDANNAFEAIVAAGTGAAISAAGFYEMTVPFAPPAVSPLGQMRLFCDGTFAQLSVNGSPYAPIFSGTPAIGSLGDGYNSGSTGVPLSGLGRIILADAGAVRINKSSVDANNAFDVDVLAGTGLAARFTGATISCPHTGLFSERFGVSAIATALSCTALGHTANASGVGATAVGQNSVALAASSVAVGNSANSNGGSSVAVGSLSLATGLNSTALGATASATAATTTALGFAASATVVGSTAVGASASAAFGSATAIGAAATASGVQGTAVGFGANAGQIAVAIGFAASALGQNAVAIGQTSNANEDNVAIGQNALSTFFQGTSVSVGWLAQSNALRTVAVGGVSTANFTDSVAVGNTAVTSGIQSVALGKSSNGGGGCVAVGFSATTIGVTNAIAIGASSIASAVNAIAIGRLSVASGVNAVAIGTSTTVATSSSVAVGNTIALAAGNTLVVIVGTTAAALPGLGSQFVGVGNNLSLAAVGANCVAIGFAAICGGSSTTVVGAAARATASSAVVVGASADAGANANTVLIGQAGTCAAIGATAVGFSADALAADCISLGRDAQSSALGAIAIGAGANASAASSTALGAGATASGLTSTALGAAATTAGFAGSIALGSGATCTVANQLVIGAAGAAITASVFGNGVTSAAPLDHTMRTTGGNAAGINGASFLLQPGDGGALADRSGFIQLDVRAAGAAAYSAVFEANGTGGARVKIGQAVTVGVAARSSLDVFGSFGIGAIRTIADAAFPGTQLDTDYLILADATGIGRVLNLVSTTGRQGRHVVIRKAAGAGASVVVTPAAGDTVDSAATLTITGNPANQAVILMADDVNNNWVVLATRN